MVLGKSGYFRLGLGRNVPLEKGRKSPESLKSLGWEIMNVNKFQSSLLYAS